MIAALVTGGVVVLAVVAYSWWTITQVRDAERRTADARVSEQDKLGKLAIAATDLKNANERGDREKERADALDDVLDDVASDGDAHGARARVLRRISRKATAAPNAADGGDTGAVPASEPDPSVARGSDDALLKPGE